MDLRSEDQILQSAYLPFALCHKKIEEVNVKHHNMKLVLIASSLLAFTCYGFTPQSAFFGTRQSAAFKLQATSNEDAIEEALRISKEKGASSQEARVAWDIVEELNASDNS